MTPGAAGHQRLWRYKQRWGGHTSDRGGGLWEVLTLDYQEAAQLRERQNLCCSTTYWKTKERPLMAPHSSVLAWKIPWTEEPSGLQFMGSLRVGHNWPTSLSLLTYMHWRRKWQPTPVFLPGKSHGQRSLVGCHLWGRTVGHDWSDLVVVVVVVVVMRVKNTNIVDRMISWLFN